MTTHIATKRITIVTVISIMASCVIELSCAKLPEKLISPTLKIETSVKDNKEAYKLMLSTGLHNENSDTALVDVKGNIVFTDPADSGGRVLSFPFELPVILPFDTGIIEIEKLFSEEEIMPLVNLMGADKEKLQNDGGLERSLTDDKNVALELTDYQKKSILDLLKEKVNEKNQ
ncbi:MAG: hypothetical protein JW807_14730 [Spirochaetes bacterium]|nr:hypothetical protein [Spirochaetota bacterium]